MSGVILQFGSKRSVERQRSAIENSIAQELKSVFGEDVGEEDPFELIKNLFGDGHLPLDEEPRDVGD